MDSEQPGEAAAKVAGAAKTTAATRGGTASAQGGEAALDGDVEMQDVVAAEETQSGAVEASAAEGSEPMSVRESAAPRLATAATTQSSSSDASRSAPGQKKAEAAAAAKGSENQEDDGEEDEEDADEEDAEEEDAEDDEEEDRPAKVGGRSTSSKMQQGAQEEEDEEEDDNEEDDEEEDEEDEEDDEDDEEDENGEEDGAERSTGGETSSGEKASRTGATEGSSTAFDSRSGKRRRQPSPETNPAAAGVGTRRQRALAKHAEEEGPTGQERKWQRRNEYLDEVAAIEEKFAKLKAEYFEECSQTIQEEIDAIRTGDHAEYNKRCEELLEFKEEKLWASEQWKQYQIENANNVYDGDVRAAESEYVYGKKQLRDRMMQALRERRRKLRDEQNLLDPDDTSYSSQVTTRNHRQSRDNAPADRAYSRRKWNPPNVQYALKDSEILHDLHLIQKRTLRTTTARTTTTSAAAAAASIDATATEESTPSTVPV